MTLLLLNLHDTKRNSTWTLWSSMLQWRLWADLGPPPKLAQTSMYISLSSLHTRNSSCGACASEVASGSGTVPVHTAQLPQPITRSDATQPELGCSSDCCARHTECRFGTQTTGWCFLQSPEASFMKRLRLGDSPRHRQLELQLEVESTSGQAHKQLETNTH